MATVKIAITLAEDLVKRLDDLVRTQVFPNRSRAIQVAVAEKLDRLDRNRLARECAKLDRGIERSLADDGLAGGVAEWPEY